jgi:PAS domain S-box-containing protein
VTARPVSATRAYSFAILTFLIAFLLRAGIDPWVGKSVPFILFFPAIMVAARYGGFGPGMLVTLLSAGSAVVRSLEPPREFGIGQPSDLLSLALFTAVGALIASLSDTVRRAEADQAQLSAIVQSSDDAIVGKDLNGAITSWNAAAERLFGYRAAEAIGRSIAMIIPPERRSEEDDVIQTIRAGRRVEPFETVRRRKDGSDVDVSVTVSPIVDGNGAIVGASKIARDISERRRIERMRADLIERQRVASEDALQARDRLAFLSEVGALLASSLDYEETLDRAVHLALPRLGDYCNVLIQDEQGHLRHAAWGHVDRQKEPVLRDLARLMLESPQTPRIPTFAERVIAGGQTMVVARDALSQAVASLPRELSPELIEIGRQLQPHAYVGVPLFVRGRAVGAMAFGTTDQDSRRDYGAADVALIEEFSRRVSIAIENARLFRHADELNRFKDEFLATLSHEMRTPLAAVLGWTRMLANGQLDAAKARQAIEAIERNAQAQAKIVDDILDVARGMEGNLRLEMTRFDLVDAVNRAVEAMTPTALAKHIHVEVAMPEPVEVVGDPNRLRQVAWNLMSNAVKFTPPGGTVTVALAAADGSAELRISDTGVGIPPAFLPYVFDKFRQADASFTRQHGGLGLGLAIARHLIELHGGSIEARSAGEGSGATFVVRVPLPAAGVS